MNLLLVTHIALGAITDDVKLSQKTRKLILSPRNTIWVSAVNLWEIAIKHSLGRETMPISGKQAIQYFSEAGYRYLSIEPEHAAAIEDLPLLHQDPFDRLLTTQALIEPMRLITHDTKLAQYSDTIILV